MVALVVALRLQFVLVQRKTVHPRAVVPNHLYFSFCVCVFLFKFAEV